MKKFIILWCTSSIILAWCSYGGDTQVVSEKIWTEVSKNKITNEVKTQGSEQAFLSSKLITNTAISSIDQKLVFGWGPAKDGIPAINSPEFLTISEAKKELSFLGEQDYGIAVSIDWETKYYPYGILVWHEIVNDEIAGQKVAVTFCPLCGSAIVFDRNTDEGELQFWVSWKLYESNMLMYDTTTESLWSQSLWEAVIGDKTGQKLEIINSQLMTFWELQSNYPNAKVLSDNTWHVRNYGFVPYWDYDTSEDLYFSVQNEDVSFSKKEIFYIIPIWDDSAAFHLADLRSSWEIEYKYWDELVQIQYDNGIIKTVLWWEELPGYYEMWFSWRTHNTENENIWSSQINVFEEQ